MVIDNIYNKVYVCRKELYKFYLTFSKSLLSY